MDTLTFTIPHHVFSKFYKLCTQGKTIHTQRQVKYIKDTCRKYDSLKMGDMFFYMKMDLCVCVCTEIGMGHFWECINYMTCLL